MKLVLVISSLGGGGAERVMATLANAWANEGHEVTLITFSQSTGDRYMVVPKVARVTLPVAAESKNIIEGFINNVRRIMALRRAISNQHPDAVVSFMTRTNLLTILACRGLRIPVIASERVYFGANPARGIWKRLFRPVYRTAAAIVAQTERGALDLGARLGRPVVVIPNPVSGALSEETAKASSPTQNIVLAMGRMEKQKGFDLLIEAFSRIASTHPSWNLVILGEGPERKALEAQIERSGLKDRISMPGFCDAPTAMMRQARVFVLSSRYEGLPNALMEAMASGLPCVSFDCLTGPAELIQHDVNGLLVPPEDVTALAGEMGRFMGDADLRARLGSAAASSLQSYSRASVVGKWNALLQSVRAGTAKTPRPTDRTSVLYIMGSSRSGSTLLGATLNAHPDAFDVGELCNLHRAMDIRAELCACRTPSAQCHFWADVRQAWKHTSPLDDKEYWALQANFERLLKYPLITLPFHGRNDRWRLYVAATAELFKAIARVSGAKIIIDSSKHPVRALALAQNSELNVRVIHLVRDVRGVAHSLSRSWDADPVRGIASPIVGQQFFRTAADWLVSNFLSSRVSASLGKRSMRLRYEDLVHDPVEALGRVSALIDLDYSQVAQKIIQGETLKGGHQIAGNRLRMQAVIRMQPDTTWRNEMTLWNRRWLWLMTSPMMARYGYRP